MSKNAKIVLWVIVIIVIIFVGWWYFGTGTTASAPTSAPVTEATPSMEQNQAQQNQINQTASATNSVPVVGLSTSPSDTSDAALNADMSVISSQSAALDQESTQ